MLVRCVAFAVLAAASFAAPASAEPSDAERLQAQAVLKEAQSLLSGERFAEAVEKFREAIRLDPSLMMAHYGLGKAHMALKEYPAAVTAFSGARDAFHSAAGEAASRRLEGDKARDDRIRQIRDRIQELQSAPVAPGTPAAIRRDAKISEWEMEIDMLQRSRGVGGPPQTPAALSLALGSAYFRSGRMAEAEREYRAALEVAPKMGEPRNNLAVVLLLTGRPAEAKEQIEMAEKHGFRVAAGLKQDVDKALAGAR